MRAPERIERIIDLLREVWTEVPQWRLTQLVINASDTNHDCGPVFYMEDDELEAKLATLKTSLKKIENGDQNKNI